MQKLRSRKGISTAVLLAVYLFVAFFSQNFHHHGSGLFFKDFHFKKNGNTISVSKTNANFTDCLSCHIHYEGNSEIPQECAFPIRKFDGFRQEIFAYNQRVFAFSTLHFQLRGPPISFI